VAERPTLIDAHEKLRWAKHHFDVLKPAIEAFEKRDTHRITFEIDAQTSEYRFSVHDLEEPSPDWGLTIGDCIHNARTALDYLMVRLWALVTGQDPADIAALQFPIYSPDPQISDAAEALRDVRKRFGSAVGKCRSELGFSGYLARIEELQPFNQANPSIWGVGKGGFPRNAALPDALQLLSTFDNTDKHRVPHVTWATINVFSTPGIDTIAPPEFKGFSGGRSYAPLKDGAQVGTARWETPLPREWEPTEVEMQRCFPLKVAFGDVGPFKGVLDLLPYCLWGVEAVLALFEPVFRDYPQPPLPVTAITQPGM
jgi:hypothetical protein